MINASARRLRSGSDISFEQGRSRKDEQHVGRVFVELADFLLKLAEAV
jgi:hypothetical protein